jgi:hypothetical protein
VRGEIHHDRRLHQLMLQEEINQVGALGGLCMCMGMAMPMPMMCGVAV